MSCRGGLPLSLWKNAATVFVEFIPIDHQGLAFDGIRGQGHKAHVVDGANGFAGGLGYCSIKITLGHIETPYKNE
jgi:hypothetical protein